MKIGHFCEKLGVFPTIFGMKRHRKPTAYATKGQLGLQYMSNFRAILETPNIGEFQSIVSVNCTKSGKRVRALHKMGQRIVVFSLIGKKIGGLKCPPE